MPVETTTPVRSPIAPTTVPYIPDPEVLSPERLCPNQKERLTRKIEES